MFYGYNPLKMEVIDSYEWPVNVSIGATRAGTEELSFFSETGTYNRDNIPCCDFPFSEELINSINQNIERLNSSNGESSKNVQDKRKILIMEGEKKNG